MLSLLSLLWLTCLVPVFTLKVSEFYPFGEEQGDTTMAANDDGSSPNIPISTKFPFFNHQHDQLIVNTNGAISFLAPVSQYTPDTFPLDGDRRLITPFWADVDTTKGGHVRYRETTDSNILEKVSSEIKTYFPKFHKFHAAWIFIATWDNVAFFGCSGSGLLKRNTFQAVLITNGQHSFTIFNYANIEWTTGTGSGGNEDTGLGGTPAQAGFNAGDGKIYYAVNGSQTPDIINIAMKTNVGVPGKFAFRIDSAQVETGGCNTKGAVIISPKTGPMFGGQHLTFSGPCIYEYDIFKVKFSGIRKTLSCHVKSKYSFYCITPKFSTTGDIDVFVTLFNRHTSNSTETLKGHYTVLNPVFCKVFVIRNNPDNWRNGIQTISWEKNAPELEDSDRVDLQVHTLKEKNGKLYFKRTVAIMDIPNSNGLTDFNFNVTQQVAMLQVKSRVKRKGMPDSGIWSDVFLVSQSREEARKSCEKWIKSESFFPELNAREPCPCTLQQALIDIVKYQPDPDCNMFHMGSEEKRNCRYRRDAQHCVRLPRPSKSGSDNVCCYNTKGNLIDSRIQEGGTQQRFHYLGGVPYISNFYHDVMPFMQCCRFSQTSTKYITDKEDSYSLCQDFLKLRNYSSCQNYEPPRLARTSGDPHMTTLDGLSYTFNGAGEFVYIYTEDELFKSQIRFEQFQKDDGLVVPATVATAVVMEYANSSDRIEVRLNSIRTVDVLQNSEPLDFDESRWMDLKGVTILLLPAEGNSTDRSLMVMFKDIKIAFNIQASKKILNVLPIVHGDEIKGKIKGLLGNYDENPSNDLLSSSDQQLLPNASDVMIFNQFGMSWAINETESLFTYEPGKSFVDYQQPSFRPMIESSLPITEEVTMMCGEDKDCIFDFSVTGSQTVAKQSLTFQKQFHESQLAAVIVRTCDDLPTVIGGVWESTNGNLENSSAIFVCREGYNVSGLTRSIFCKNGHWDPYGNISCLRHDTIETVLQPNKTSAPLTSRSTETTPSTNASEYLEVRESTLFTLISKSTETTPSTNVSESTEFGASTPLTIIPRSTETSTFESTRVGASTLLTMIPRSTETSPLTNVTESTGVGASALLTMISRSTETSPLTNVTENTGVGASALSTMISRGTETSPLTNVTESTGIGESTPLTMIPRSTDTTSSTNVTEYTEVRASTPMTMIPRSTEALPTTNTTDSTGVRRSTPLTMISKSTQITPSTSISESSGVRGSTPLIMTPKSAETVSSTNVPVYIGIGGGLLCIFIFIVLLFRSMMKKRRFGEYNIHPTYHPTVRTSNVTKYFHKENCSAELSPIRVDKTIYPAR